VNKIAEGITGYTREELYQINMWDLVHPEFKPMVMERAAQRLKGQAAPDRYDYAIVAKDGTVKWLDFGAATITFEGKPCLLATAMDITERRLAQQALMSSEKLAATGRMAATIAHEINNPLEAVTNLLYLARTQPENTQKYLEMADEELKRVAHITKQTLGFYRDPTSATKVAPARLLEDVLSIYSRRLENKQIAVLSEFDEAAQVTAYSGEIRQVFSNLVSNAVDAMPNGGKLYLRVRQGRRVRDSIPGVLVTIADTGAGIPRDTMKRIFEPFFTTKSDVGTGLGLWLTRGIIEKHKGTIRVRSRVDRGTVFQVFLPESTNDKLTTEAAA
jgi:PAS domain S-box-containing protein